MSMTNCRGGKMSQEKESLDGQAASKEATDNAFYASMEKAGVTGQASKLKAERTAIRDTLKTFKFSGVTGNVCFNKFGDAQLPTYVMEIVNSDVRMIDSHPSKKCS